MAYLIHHREEVTQGRAKSIYLDSKEEHCVCKMECRR